MLFAQEFYFPANKIYIVILLSSTTTGIYLKKTTVWGFYAICLYKNNSNG